MWSLLPGLRPEEHSVRPPVRALLRPGMQMFIVYDQVVDVTRSQLVIDTFTLVNRLGGCIGFCKEILWVTLLLAGISNIIKKLHGVLATNMK